MEPDEVAEGIVIATRLGDLVLARGRVAAPCVEFTSFLLRLPTVLTNVMAGAGLALAPGAPVPWKPVASAAVDHTPGHANLGQQFKDLPQATLVVAL